MDTKCMPAYIFVSMKTAKYDGGKIYMTFDPDNLMDSIIASLGRIDYIKPEEIPPIDLYMDQVTTFMESHLSNTKRHEEDKILTKTMINNYAKNDLLPPPEKKKYNSEHIMLLIFIYYFKNILSISDIDKLMGPLREDYFNVDGKKLTLEDIYQNVFSKSVGQLDQLKTDVKHEAELAQEACKNADPEEAEYLNMFSFICMLGFDVYVKKLMIEKLIDLMPDNDPKKKR